MKRLILLADDSPTIQRLVTQTFVGGDFDVVSVSNGDAAIKKFEEVRPDIVLADIYMPGKNGYEVCAAVKKHAELGDTPVVLLAGAFDAFDDETASEVGAADHITKPFEPQALVNLVSQLVPKGSGRDRPPLPPTIPRKEIAMPAFAPTPLAPPVLAADEVSLPAPAPVVADAVAMTPVADAVLPSIPAAPVAVQAAPAKPVESGDLLGLQEIFKPAASLSSSSLSEADIQKIVERVIQKMSTQVIESVAWDVVPDITTKVLNEELKKRS